MLIESIARIGVGWRKVDCSDVGWRGVALNR